jgi:hypothetical protein
MIASPIVKRLPQRTGQDAPVFSARPPTQRPRPRGVGEEDGPTLNRRTRARPLDQIPRCGLFLRSALVDARDAARSQPLLRLRLVLLCQRRINRRLGGSQLAVERGQRPPSSLLVCHRSHTVPHDRRRRNLPQVNCRARAAAGARALRRGSSSASSAPRRVPAAPALRGPLRQSGPARSRSHGRTPCPSPRGV